MSLLLGLTVFQAESLALARNPSLKAAGHTALSSRWSAWGSWASLGPQAAVSASYSDAGAFGWQGTGKVYNLRFSLSQSVFSSQRLTSALSSTRSWQAQAASLEYQRLSTRLQAAQAFIAALKARRSVRVREKALERAREALRLAEERYKLGDASEAELAKAKAEALSAELSLLRAQTEEKKALLALKEVLGGFEPDSLEEPPEPDTALPPLDSLLNLAFRRRGDLRQLERSAAAAGWSFWGSLLSFLPEVSLSYSWSYWGEESPGSFDDFTKTSGFSWSLSFPITSWPFSFMAQAEARRAAAARVDAKRFAVAREVAGAYEDLRTALQALGVAEEGYRAAEKAFELTKAKYELGEASALELVDAERSLAEAELNFQSAKLDLFLARRSLEIAVGGLE